MDSKCVELWLTCSMVEWPIFFYLPVKGTMLPWPTHSLDALVKAAKAVESARRSMSSVKLFPG